MIKNLYFRLIASILPIYLIGAFTFAFGQEDTSETIVKVKIVTEKDGKKEVVEKTYDSMEEFEADESMHKEHIVDMENIHNIDVSSEDGEHKMIKIKKSASKEEISYSMKITVDDDGKTKTIIKEGDKTFTIKDGEKVHTYKYMFDTDDDKEHKMVFITDDGTKTDVEFSGDDHIWISKEDGEHKVIKLDDGKKIIIVRADGDADVEVEELKEINITVTEDSENEIQISVDVEDNGDSIKEKRIKKVIVMTDEDDNYTTSIEDMDDIDLDSDMNVWVQKMKEGGEMKTVTVEVIKKEKIDVSVSDVETDDPELEEFDLGDYKPLKLKSFTCNTDPNEGKFNLTCTTSAKPTSVRIYDKSGKKIFFEKMDDFAGSYSKDINLGGNAKGTYILQISQGGKAVNKKLLIK